MCLTKVHQMIKKTFSIITLAAITLFSQSTFALFSKASAMDLDGYYITPKVGVSVSEKTGKQTSLVLVEIIVNYIVRI